MCLHHNCLVIVTSSAIDCDVILKRKPSGWDTGSICEDHRFNCHLWIRYVMWKIKQCTYSRNEHFIHSLECYFGVYFPRCCVTQEINTKITLLWACKQFTTQVQSTPVISRLLGAKICKRELSGSPVISRCRAKATDPHSQAFTTRKQYVVR